VPVGLGEEWFDSGARVVSTLQTSLVVEPANGRVPLTKTAEEIHANDIAHQGDSWEYMSTWDRCVARGVPGGMFPGTSDSGYQIIQTPGYVVIASEILHEAHIVPLTDKHLSAAVKQLNGDSIGRWEGDTLVVDTTGYNGRGQIVTSLTAGRMNGMRESTQLHVVERFTRTAPDTIIYDVTIDDPVMYTSPWKVSLPFTRNDNYRIYEYACHEGNLTTGHTLQNARAAEKAAQRQ
jgi:hypothetical protein